MTGNLAKSLGHFLSQKWISRPLCLVSKYILSSEARCSSIHCSSPYLKKSTNCLQAEQSHTEDEVVVEEEMESEVVTCDFISLVSELVDDPEYVKNLKEYCSIPGYGHRLMVIHPAVKWGYRKPKLTTKDLQLEEACSLVNTLPRWKVVDKMIMSVKSTDGFIFGTGQFKELSEAITKNKSISAVYLNVDILKINQVAIFQAAWKLPVFDRYTLVLEIFKEHALTREAKLQIALAEVPYIRGRLAQIHEGNHDHQTGHTHYVQVGGFKTSYIQQREALLNERERKLKVALDKIKRQRSQLREGRMKRRIPTVAVVGYTNSGKTTLIKALTGDERLIPKNQLFATLDVTTHAGMLPSHMTVLFIDTVGFISNIPVNLINAFSATLEDAMLADVIVHVRDTSHLDAKAQNMNVLQVLAGLIPEDKLSRMIIANNKVDLVGDVPNDSSVINISAVTGFGLDVLKDKIQKELLESAGYMEKIFRIPMSGEHLSWLYKEATVKSTETDDVSESLIVHTIISKVAYQKFVHKFKKSRSK